MKNEKVADNGRKVNVNCSRTFCCILPLYEKWNKPLKINGRKVKALAFLPLYEKWEVSKNGRKVKAVIK